MAFFPVLHSSPFRGYLRQRMFRVFMPGIMGLLLSCLPFPFPSLGLNDPAPPSAQGPDNGGWNSFQVSDLVMGLLWGCSWLKKTRLKDFGQRVGLKLVLYRNGGKN